MEDFVTFEIAKKLKENGFDLETSNVYERNIIACRYEDYPKPTISQVLKWLRDNKRTMTDILPVAFNEKENKFNKYYCTIYYATKEFVFESHERPDTFETYEECALDAIEYSLDNLI